MTYIIIFNIFGYLIELYALFKYGYVVIFVYRLKNQK